MLRPVYWDSVRAAQPSNRHFAKLRARAGLSTVRLHDMRHMVMSMLMDLLLSALILAGQEGRSGRPLRTPKLAIDLSMEVSDDHAGTRWPC